MSYYLYYYSEKAFEVLNMLGLGEPLTRACVGGLVGAFPLIWHPKICYTEVDEGIFIPRNFLLTSPDDPEGTLFPWWLIPILGALFFGLVL